MLLTAFDALEGWVDTARKMAARRIDARFPASA
jgi:hypothetical protein